MSKYSEKTALVSAVGSNLLRHAPGRERAAGRAGSPGIARILRENRPIFICDFFGAGSKRALAPGETAQIAQIPKEKNAKSFEKIDPRFEASGRIMRHSHPPQNAAEVARVSAAVTTLG